MSQPTERRIRLILSEGRSNTREQIRTLLESEPIFFLQAAFRSGIEAVSAIRRLKPDIILMDLQQPDSDGLTLARVIKRMVPDSCVMLIVNSNELNQHAIACGVNATVSKSRLHNDLIPILKRVSSTYKF